MEHFIKCPACCMTNVEPTQIGRGAGDKYLCADCRHGFTVEYKKTPQNIVEQYWKKGAVAAIVLL
ncbi:hypothetical protein MmiEs2_01080 [Methanimicrococcus stummii]|uniref:Uncharacterized protein n=1 Tax=Methanimicrococcus stummii TaxID=3028294 RepID=A0AA96V7D8_9EURY|nr:hypothetical protein [Methanimicrococcus sp. Es2]WNY27929.1 hypothetical protein MmiEs2_01080 [Methanimicrococcus sp. Es2]